MCNDFPNTTVEVCRGEEGSGKIIKIGVLDDEDDVRLVVTGWVGDASRIGGTNDGVVAIPTVRVGRPSASRR